MLKGMGWQPDLPDFRDYTADHPTVAPMLAKLGAPGGPPATVDLRQWCSPVEDQGQLGSCTANAAAGIVEYFERRAFGKYLNVSRLFIYKATRNLMKISGDTGAYLRTTMGALVLFGAPPEDYWPYDIRQFDAEPSSFLYAMGQNYQAIKYFSLDPPGTPPATVLGNVKARLAAGLPAMFGFTVYESFRTVGADGLIPFPRATEKVLGGHAIAAVGYNDTMQCPNAKKGALLIRNSWGPTWGLQGYAWFPYDYVLKGLAQDFWCLVQSEWVDTGVFMP
jgi:C1A family cysteine protease